MALGQLITGPLSDRWGRRLFAYISGSSFLFQDAFGVSSGTFSLIFGLNALGLVALGQLNAKLLDRALASLGAVLTLARP